MYLIFFLFIVLYSHAQTDEINFEKVSILSSKHWLDVDYVGDGIIAHRMDIHLPVKGKGPFPVVVIVYGSAWFSNSSKANVFKEGLGQQLLMNGFAVVSINHRSSRDSIFPAQIQDVKASIRFIRANSSKFNLDISFIGITGWSSGGHLASLAGTTNGINTHSIHEMAMNIEGSLGKYTTTSSKVNAVVDWFGPTDFLMMDKCGSSFSHDDQKSPESSLIGGKIQDNPDRCALANPITYVRGNDKEQIPPFLILHGDKDPLVPACESEKLYEALQVRGIRSELIIVPGGAHGPGVMINTYYERMIRFFKNELKVSLKSNSKNLK
ncbi:MAG: alpha/beta hydrolase [Saprospiraceae bacterium]